jgi:hypothetical protein
VGKWRYSWRVAECELSCIAVKFKKLKEHINEKTPEMSVFQN